MINYYYEWEGDVVFKVDTEGKKYYAKLKGLEESEINFEHPGLQRAFMSGEKITKQKYDDF
jgi:sensor domain CHASE-containing protein